MELGLNKKEQQRYSLVKAVGDLLAFREVRGVERACSDEIAKRFEKTTLGFFVPGDILRCSLREANGLSRSQAAALSERVRALNATTATAGGFTVAEEAINNSYIENLYARAVTAKLGARRMSGLTGVVPIPKLTGSAAPGWKPESAASPSTEQTFGQLILSPKRLTGIITASQQLFKQSSLDIEALIRSDAASVNAVEKDRKAICGIGGAEPLGILHTPNVNTLTFGGTPTWEEITDFEAQVGNDNAEGDDAEMGFCTTPNVRKKLKNTERVTDSGIHIWGDDNRLCGRRAEVTSLVTDNRLVFGRWSDLILADWGTIELVIDWATLAGNNQLRIIINSFDDSGLRHPEAFCISTDSAAQ